ncbi:MAG: hypothetical protein BZY87_02890 [SAR202 cluster bacterium Io17-Chloro-G6]|nr:MAG: hypothetical protein BZY87_02890 [SAR202 cluster bacterium Io17-Chloro-G6]
MAIAGIMSVPLSGIIAAQLRVPLKISDEVKTATKLQSSTVVLMNDAVSSRSFTPGVAPEYGTFEWIEFAGAIPVAVTSRYYWAEESVFRVLTWDGSSSAPFLLMGGIEEFGDVVFRHTPSQWKFDPNTDDWAYTRGGIAVDLDIERQSTDEVSELLSRGIVVADFRPSFERPVQFPSPLQ